CRLKMRIVVEEGAAGIRHSAAECVPAAPVVVSFAPVPTTPAGPAALSQVLLQKGQQIILPDGNALGRENEVPGRDVAWIAGRSERWIDDGFLRGAGSMHRVAHLFHCLSRGVVFGIHTEDWSFDFSRRLGQGILQRGAAIPRERAARLIYHRAERSFSLAR